MFVNKVARWRVRLYIDGWEITKVFIEVLVAMVCV